MGAHPALPLPLPLQMHLHVADVQPDLLAALRTVQPGAGWKTMAGAKGRAATCKGGSPGGTPWVQGCISCAGQRVECKGCMAGQAHEHWQPPFSCPPAVTADPVTDRTPIAAQCVAASSPAAARPFETVYATPNDVIYSAMVVASPRQGEICIVRATDRPVSTALACLSWPACQLAIALPAALLYTGLSPDAAKVLFVIKSLPLSPDVAGGVPDRLRI